MSKTIDILKVLDGKWDAGTRPKDLYKNYVQKNPDTYTDILITGLSSEKKKVQSGCAELVSLSSESNPDLFYKYINIFIENINAAEPVLRWEAVCILGNLSAVDKKKKIVKVLDQLFPFLENESIVLQGHALRALSKVAAVEAKSAKLIYNKIMAAKSYFPDNRIGFIVEVMEQFLKYPDLHRDIQSFLELQLKSDIPVVVKKAKKINAKLAKQIL